MFGLRRGLAVMCRHSSPTIGLCLPFSPCTVVPRPTQPMMGEALVSTPTPTLHALHEIPVSLLPSLSTNNVPDIYVVLYRLAYYVGDPCNRRQGADEVAQRCREPSSHSLTAVLIVSLLQPPSIDRRVCDCLLIALSSLKSVDRGRHLLGRTPRRRRCL